MSTVKEVFLDVETQKIFDDVSRRDPKLLGVSFVGIYERETDRLHGYFENELSSLWPVLENATKIIGFNIKRFDMPVLSAYYPGDLLRFPLFDMWEVIKNQLGFSLGLDNLARATLKEGKTGTGLDAIRLFIEGKLDQLSSYCLNDVELTRKLYDYGKSSGKLKFITWKNEVEEFPVHWDIGTENKGDVQMSLGV